MKYARLLSILLGLLVCSCGEEVQTPKPRGYFRITFPAHHYKAFDPADCPFRFEIPDYAVMIRDTNTVSQPCWYYLMLPSINGQIYLTYREVNGNLNSIIEDTRTLVYKHTSRASSIDEEMISFGKGVYGVMYDIGGDAASPAQFFVTDSTHHFLRGAVYFNTLPNADSLAPAVTFVKQDVEHLLKTLEWK